MCVCVDAISYRCGLYVDQLYIANACNPTGRHGDMCMQDEVQRFDEVESVKTDLIAARGIAYIKFRTASSALQAKEDVDKHSVVRLPACLHAPAGINHNVPGPCHTHVCQQVHAHHNWQHCCHCIRHCSRCNHLSESSVDPYSG